MKYNCSPTVACLNKTLRISRMHKELRIECVFIHPFRTASKVDWRERNSKMRSYKILLQNGSLSRKGGTLQSRKTYKVVQQQPPVGQRGGTGWQATQNTDGEEEKRDLLRAQNILTEDNDKWQGTTCE